MKSFCCVLLFLFSLQTATYAQGWERLYPLNLGLGYFTRLAPMPDGGFLVTVDEETFNLPPHALVKLAPDGSLQWVQNQQDVLGMVKVQMLPAGNGDMLFFGRSGAGPRLVRTNANLDILWSKNYNGICSGCNLILRPTAGGYLLSAFFSNEYDPASIIKVNESGEEIWSKTFNFGNAQNFTGMRSLIDMVSDGQGNIYVSGVQDFPYAPMLAKISPAGSQIFLKTYTQPELIYGFNLAVFNDNRILGSSTYVIGVLDSNGVVVDTITQGPCQMKASGDGNLLVGYSQNANMVLRKITLGSQEIWKTTADLIFNLEKVGSVWTLPDGGAVAIGQAFTGSSYDPYVVRVDANGNTFTNRIFGQVFLDFDGDCLDSPPDDQPASGLIVQAIQGDQTWYTATDASGNYGILLDTGTYLLRVMPPNALWQPCADSIPLTLDPVSDTLEQNVGVKSDFDCPWPEVSIGAALLRRCFSSAYTVTYSNNGSVTADSAVVRLTLDPFLELQSATWPYTQVSAQVYDFFVGDLSPLQQGSFQVTVLVDCDSTVLGQTHCSSVDISIANPCPSTLLDFPVITVEADCTGDSVAFTVQNIGGAPMASPAEFIVIEDLIVMREGAFQLGIQEDTLIRCPADGSTFRMYAGQASGELPFFSPTAAIEGCNGPVQPGFWNMFPEFYPAGSDRDCQPNIGAYDPNDKQGRPAGYDTEHYIAPGVDLDYTIRFQNTGTDTAFNIVVRDTLSPWLDPASVRPGPASHPYIWTLMGQNVLEFKFQNILLPDSNVNLAGSQGYFRFHVAQQPGIPLETDVFNRAAIYFDFNAPVITNTTQHRVGKNFIQVAVWTPADPLVTLRAFPNPASEGVTVELSEIEPGTVLEWTLCRLSGETALRRTTTGGRWDFRREQLPAGMYWLQVREKGKLIGVGKVMFY